MPAGRGGAPGDEVARGLAALLVLAALDRRVAAFVRGRAITEADWPHAFVAVELRLAVPS
jgi:hypothetical protein